MTLAYLIDGGLNDPDGAAADLCERFPAARDVFVQAAEETRVPYERLLTRRLPPHEEHREAGAIRQAAMALGIADVLAGHGIRPDAVAGLSLGGMIGGCLVGAIDRPALFRVLERLRHAPGPSGRSQGVAAVMMPASLTMPEYLGPLPDGVYVSTELGTPGAVDKRYYLLAGYRDALEHLAAGSPAGAVTVLDLPAAYHSPLSGYIREFLEPTISGMEFSDPERPLCSCVEPRLLTTGAEIRELFLDHHVRCVSIPHLIESLDRNGTELGIMLGPAQIRMYLGNSPFPILHVDSPDHVTEALAGIHELGIGRGPRQRADRARERTHR